MDKEHRYPSIHIYGLQRSGTNYLRQLLELNFDVHVSNFGTGGWDWKHSLHIPSEKEYQENHPTISGVFMIRKNPFKWIESIKDRFGFAKFINQHKKFSENYVKSYGSRIKELALIWKTHNDNWNTGNLPNIIKDKYYDIQYEDLLECDSRDEVLENIRGRFNFNQRDCNWKNIDYGSVLQSPNYNQEMEKYYQTPDKYKTLSDKDVKTIVGVWGNSERQ